MMTEKQHLLMHVTLTSIDVVGWFDNYDQMAEKIPSGISKTVAFIWHPDVIVYVSVQKYAGWQRNRLRASHAALVEMQSAKIRVREAHYIDE